MKHGIFLCIIWLGVTLAIVGTQKPEDHYYYIEDCGEWTEVVDRPCIVTEVCDGTVVVETRTDGELYEFYGDGFRVNERIMCTFTLDGELISAR